ncbi:M14 family metallopeptidase [Massilibacterium senegalense]|uniref:M14 family metallopeptidase n=1 Tax=Massilibacterium senegalense TaxID=1632858 RepID=UPI000782B3CE|nr:M14 family metallocarboxypeptidase [Massilibacterium senegalense]
MVSFEQALSSYQHFFNLPSFLLEDAYKQQKKWAIPGYIPKKIVKREQLEEAVEKYHQHPDWFCRHNKVDETYWNILMPVSKRMMKTKQPYHSKICEKHIQFLCTAFPFVQKKVIGYSRLNNPIYELKIGRGKRTVHFNASFHANEWITSALLMNAVKEYVFQLIDYEQWKEKNMRVLYEEIVVSIVPMVNPDGVDLVIKGLPAAGPFQSYVSYVNNGVDTFSHWKANICGVDLNNQYPSCWEKEQYRKPKHPAPRDFPGYSPLSEPESIAMAKLVEQEQVDRLVAFHSQGEEFYYGYLGHEPEESTRIAAEIERASGYKAVKTIDSYAGFRDWFIHHYRRPGFTIEVGRGENPLPLDDFDKMAAETFKIFLASLGLFS